MEKKMKERKRLMVWRERNNELDFKGSNLSIHKRMAKLPFYPSSGKASKNCLGEMGYFHALRPQVKKKQEGSLQ